MKNGFRVWFFSALLSQVVFCFSPNSWVDLRDSRIGIKKQTNLFDVVGLDAPATISSMMTEIASSIIEARKANLSLSKIDFPLPVTGGTEIDDWPGGILQKYNTLCPLLVDVMKSLKFSQSSFSKKEFLGEFGEEDAVGYWEDNGVQLCCFPTEDTIPELQKKLKWADSSTTLVLVLPQIFLDAFSRQDTRKFIESVELIYCVRNLQMKGPGALSIRGLLYRKYPGDFLIGRRLDDGSYIRLRSSPQQPTQKELNDIFFQDSVERDKNLSFFDRISSQLKNFG